MAFESEKRLLDNRKASNQDRFPELYAPNRKIDRRQCVRVVPMRVLVLGMCRTGTHSLWESLKLLGFNDCYHMMNTLIDPKDNEMWIEAINGKFFGGRPFTKRDWDMLLGHCQAVCDFPACAFGPELIAAYPDAKVILTNRNVDSWYNSCLGTIRKSMTSPLLHIMSYLDPEVMGKWSPMTRSLFRGVFDDDFEKTGKDVFRSQYEEVRRLVPKDRLLEYEIGEGWDRLCDFLDVPVPSFPYPHTNEAAAFQERSWLRFRLSLQRALPRIAMLVLSIVAFLIWLCWLLARSA